MYSSRFRARHLHADSRPRKIGTDCKFLKTGVVATFHDPPSKNLTSPKSEEQSNGFLLHLESWDSRLESHRLFHSTEKLKQPSAD